MIKTILDRAWKHISPNAPESNELLQHAQNVGNVSDTTPVMIAIEKFLAARGKGGILEKNQVWQSCKGKKPEEVFGHLKKCGKQSGKMDLITSILGIGSK